MATRQEAPGRRPIFISYKRGVAPDEAIAMDLYGALSPDHDVFVDQKSMGLGTNWARRIEEELARSEFFIPLLSEASVQSEMVVAEIEKAHHLEQEQGRPVTLPIRVAYEAPLAYPLSAYLNSINWASWRAQADTVRIIDEIHAAIVSGTMRSGSKPVSDPVVRGDELTAPTPLAQIEAPGGTMHPQSRFYVRRRVDDVGEAAVRHDGFTMVIKGPRQVGKSSLLMKLNAVAANRGNTIVLIDFERFSKPVLENPDRFFRQFCSAVAMRIKAPVSRLDECWHLDVDNIFRTSEFFEDAILPRAQAPIILAMDEVDTVFLSSFRTDFFSMLRSWHNSRASDPLWRNLSLILVTSTEPYRFIEDLTQSPFNVADTIEPDDFSREQVAGLAALHELNRSVAEPLQDLLNGHPYLTRKALYVLATGRYSLQELIRDAPTERSPFSDHLRYHLFRLNENRELIQPFLQVLSTEVCDDERSLFRLEGAGLIRKTGTRRARARCALYTTFFEEHLREVSNVRYSASS